MRYKTCSGDVVVVVVVVPRVLRQASVCSLRIKWKSNESSDGFFAVLRTHRKQIQR
jgi:hypothetical protein